MQVERLTQQPILSTTSHPAAGDNINGPSLVRVPEWVDQPLGRYYLYFAHHNGRCINMAYADSLTGPWQVLDGGVLSLQASGFRGHIASPDVHVDHRHQRMRMYFHGCDTDTDVDTPQHTRLSESINGVAFSTTTDNLGHSYWRVFEHDNAVYTLEMPGIIKRAESVSGPFQTGPALFSYRMRHSALAVRGNRLDVFYSNVGDNPESILHATVDITGDWQHWRAGPETVVLSPQGSHEGAGCAAVPSVRGMATVPVHQLRDPALFEENGQWYLLYSVAGEQGIGIARIIDF
ncbi:MAG: hypothetical protein AAF404_20525 [Pseudomonadota bacterium]